MFCVTYKGQLYACGDSTGGRLGLGALTENVVTPRIIDSLKGHVIKKVSVHPRGVHCLALTTKGEVFSWGDGENGKLGHENVW